jgi:hypothetical protein
VFGCAGGCDDRSILWRHDETSFRQAMTQNDFLCVAPPDDSP